LLKNFLSFVELLLGDVAFLEKVLRHRFTGHRHAFVVTPEAAWAAGIDHTFRRYG
jgi:hypothetical protein